MLIRLYKLTGEKFHRNTYINPDQIVWYGPIDDEEGKTVIHFTDDRKAIVEKSPRDIADILRDCGVEVWR